MKEHVKQWKSVSNKKLNKKKRIRQEYEEQLRVTTEECRVIETTEKTLKE
jgi:hypothetical protein